MITEDDGVDGMVMITEDDGSDGDDSDDNGWYW